MMTSLGFTSESVSWLAAAWTMAHYLWIGAIIGVVGLVVHRLVQNYASQHSYSAVLLFFALTVIAPIPIFVHSVAVVRGQDAARFPPQLDQSTAALLNSTGEAGVSTYSIDESNTEPQDSTHILIALMLKWGPIIWFLGAIAAALRLLAGIYGGWNLRQACRWFESEHPIIQMTRELSKALHVGFDVSVGICSRVSSPVLHGVLKPAILMPASLVSQLGMAELEMILMHELTHLKRRDNLVIIVQRIAETLLFYHPFIWVFSRALDREREFRCDEAVVSRTKRPGDYARLLAGLAEALPKKSLAVSVPMAENELVARIRRILEPGRTTMTRTGNATLLVLILLASLAFIAIPAKTMKADSVASAEGLFQEEPGKKKVKRESYRKDSKVDLNRKAIMAWTCGGVAGLVEPKNDRCIANQKNLTGKELNELLHFHNKPQCSDCHIAPKPKEKKVKNWLIPDQKTSCNACHANSSSKEIADQVHRDILRDRLKSAAKSKKKTHSKNKAKRDQIKRGIIEERVKNPGYHQSDPVKNRLEKKIFEESPKKQGHRRRKELDPVDLAHRSGTKCSQCHVAGSVDTIPQSHLHYDPLLEKTQRILNDEEARLKALGRSLKKTSNDAESARFKTKVDRLQEKLSRLKKQRDRLIHKMVDDNKCSTCHKVESRVKRR